MADRGGALFFICTDGAAAVNRGADCHAAYFPAPALMDQVFTLTFTFHLHHCARISETSKRLSQLAGFEPTRAEPIGFQVQRLNHSATTAMVHSSPHFLQLAKHPSPLHFHLKFVLEVHITLCVSKRMTDLDRTRTCNPQIRSLVPYPLGHKVC